MDGSVIAALRQASALLRIPTACELVGDLVEKGARVLVYSYHRAVEKAFSDRMRGIVDVGSVTGAVSIPARTALVDRMQAGTLPVLSATISSLKEGVDITAADAVVFIEEDWTPANVDQGIARVWRRGQGKTVTVYRLGFTSGIDAYIRRAIAVKRTVIDKIIER
jgi:SNF2 family DNA or RNA helicase